MRPPPFINFLLPQHTRGSAKKKTPLNLGDVAEYIFLQVPHPGRIGAGRGLSPQTTPRRAKKTVALATMGAKIEP